ncbi:rCG60616 [Rattus norvegicus]|uniref:RCG60616 n=1 Tax=Rattus norvegicus TaxID=10116 RepID=A6JKN4_RAT|nr:rCG60616 [Rattus norvegicus]
MNEHSMKIASDSFVSDKCMPFYGPRAKAWTPMLAKWANFDCHLDQIKKHLRVS